MKKEEKILKALANRRRLEIVCLLKRKGEADVGGIATKIQLSFKATSKHLSILAAADIVTKEQRDLHMYYRLESPLPPIAKAIVSHL